MKTLSPCLCWLLSTLAFASPQDLGRSIDRLAAHPDDPQLPEGTLGASDQALAATSSREVADLIEECLVFARENRRTPRHLASLGRAALAHGYERLGVELLNEAVQLDSPSAKGFLGVYLQANGDPQRALSLLKQARDEEFRTAQVLEALSAYTNPRSATVYEERFNAKHFNRPTWMGALFSGNVQALENGGVEALLYASALQSTLTEYYMLWLSGDPAIFLELDPHLTYKLGLKMSASEGAMDEMVTVGWETMLGTLGGTAEARQGGASLGGELSAAMSGGLKPLEKIAVVGHQATQDARRLAILYRTDKESFRRVYQGLRKFGGSESSGSSQPADPLERHGGSSKSAGQLASNQAPGSAQSVAPVASAPITVDDDPISMLERANSNVSKRQAILFRYAEGFAQVCGQEEDGTYRSERVNYHYLKRDRRVAREVGPEFALSTFSHQFPDVAALVSAAEVAPLRPTWGNGGPVHPRVEKTVIERTMNVAAVKAEAKRGPLFFRREAGDPIVYIGFPHGVIWTYDVQGTREHLATVDRVIAKTGDYFGRSREDYLASTMAGRGTHASTVLQTWEQEIPDFATFMELAMKAPARPDLFQAQSSARRGR